MLHWLSEDLVPDGETISRLPTHGTDETFMPRSGQCISLNLMLESLIRIRYCCIKAEKSSIKPPQSMKQVIFILLVTLLSLSGVYLSREKW